MALNLPKFNIATVRKWILIVIVVVATFGAGYYFGVNGYQIRLDLLNKTPIVREVPPDKSTLNFSLFWKVWDTVSSSYYDKTKIVPAQMIYGAIKGMVAAVGDPYTVFLPPSDNKVFQEDLGGAFEGVGIEIGYRGTQLAVIAPLPGSPAEKAGIKAGDFIVGIKDEAKKIDRGTVGITLPDAVQAIRGPEGSKVTLTLLRDGSATPIVVDIVRAKLNVPSVLLSYVGQDNSIAHISLLKFGGETNGQWAKAVDDISQKQNVKGVVLDLRNNPGGYLQEAVDAASEFLPVGSVVVKEQHADGSEIVYKTQREGKLTNIPVFVLINGGSASASEILAGALRDDKGVKLVGETSFGKGTIQEPLQIDGGAGLNITIAKWLTPSGFWVHEKGLTPDIKAIDDPKTAQDEQLDAAIKQILR